MLGCRAGHAPLLPGHGHLLQRRGKCAGALTPPDSPYPTGGLALGAALRALPLSDAAERELCVTGEEGFRLRGAGIQSPICPACIFVTGADALGLATPSRACHCVVRGGGFDKLGVRLDMLFKDMQARVCTCAGSDLRCLCLNCARTCPTGLCVVSVPFGVLISRLQLSVVCQSVVCCLETNSCNPSTARYQGAIALCLCAGACSAPRSLRYPSKRLVSHTLLLHACTPGCGWECRMIHGLCA